MRRNAADELCRVLPRHAAARLLRAAGRPAAGTTDALRARLATHYQLGLHALLNGAVRAELEQLADFARISRDGAVGELRARLWAWGAELEAGGCEHLGSPIQPVPIVLGGRLVHLAAERGLSPPAPRLPRPIPPPPATGPAESAPALAEPDTVEELLDNADRLLGVRLGRRGRDKGAFGARIAALLGVREHGAAEPDWRGEVEIKTVPVVRDPAGWWRVKEDPAVSMEGAEPLAKLRRVLWIARVADAGDSPVLSWYYQEWDDEIARLVSRCLHTRPKGGAGATSRGWYLHKRFFVGSGFLRALNG
jgi:hypothetical protein